MSDWVKDNYVDMVVKVHPAFARKIDGATVYVDFIDEQPQMSGGHISRISWIFEEEDDGDGS